MIVRLQDNPHIIVKPETYPITVTGNTYYNFTGSGATTITEDAHGNIVDVTIYSPTGQTAEWGLITGTITNQTDLTDYVSQSISAATSGLTSSWSGLTGLPADNSDLVNYVALEISGATSGLTSSWNEITDKPSWLSGTTLEAFQTGHTHSYNNLTDLPSLFSGDYDDLTNKPDLSIYLTGYTVTADDVTGITTSLYAPIIHTHPYSGLTGLPTLFSGDYDDLTNKPDLSVYQPVSGMSVYLTGVTWNDVTNKPDLTLQSDFSGHTSDMSIHYPMSGISITESQISDLQAYALQSAINTYTGTTAPASFLPITGLTGYWNSGETENYVTGLGYLTGYTVTADDVTGITASLYAPIVHTHSYNDLTDLPTLFTGHTFVASGGTIISQTGDEVTIYAPTGATGASGLTPTLTFTGVSVVNYTQSGTSYTIGLQAQSGNTPTLDFQGSGTTNVGYTKTGTSYTVYVQAASGITPTLIFSGGSTGTTIDYTQVGATYYIAITGQTGAQGIQGGAGSGATILISSGATIATYISGSTTGNTWNVYSPDYNYVNIKSITGTSYTTIAGDSNKILECASGCTGMTLHSGATTGFQLTIVNLGGQTITFTAQSGSTLRSKDSAVTLVNQYGAVTAYKNNTYWTLIGDLS